MDKKAQENFWYGCGDCQYEPSKNDEMSNEDWSVYDCGKCPKCGKQMLIYAGKPQKLQGE